MKCWFVHSQGEDEELTEFVIADTRNKARYEAWFRGDVDWIDIVAKRVPELDGDDRPTDRQVYDLDKFWVSCINCGQQIYNNPTFDKGDYAYCGASCLVDFDESTKDILGEIT